MLRAGLSGGIERFQMMWNNSDSEVEQLGVLCGSSDSVVEGPGFCGRSTFRGGVERIQR